MRDLSIGERQRVEILKVLMGGARLVILDEPTSVLAPQEVDAPVRRASSALRAEGLSVVIITHKLARDPRDRRPRARCCAAASSSSAARRSRDLTDDELIEAMVGQRGAAAARATRPAPDDDATPRSSLDRRDGDAVAGASPRSTT